MNKDCYSCNYEDYCSFEASKLLKEIGYPQNIGGSLFWYSADGIDKTKDIIFKSEPIVAGDIAAPSLAKAMKWIRENKYIFIHIVPYMSNWTYQFFDLLLELPCDFSVKPLSVTFEEACEMAIKDCIKNYIKKNDKFENKDDLMVDSQ